MKHTLRVLALLFCLACPALISADPAEDKMTFIPWTGGTFKSDWPGIAGRTYFYQWSFDLETWQYAPFMAFGTGGHEYFMNYTPGKRFVRLSSQDANWVSTLQEARNADFDADGIPNYFEVENLFSDPFDRNSNGGDSDNGGAGDGLSDGWELFFFGNLTTANPSAVGQPDGLTNKEKSDLGLNPNTDYSDPNATQPSSFTYDLTGRLTGVTAPVGTATYAPDEEGNLLNAQ